MDTVRRFPGLKCERCGSDEFEIHLYFNTGNDIVGGKDFRYKMYLFCAHCPRVFGICGVRRSEDISELFPSESEWEEMQSRREKFE